MRNRPGTIYALIAALAFQGLSGLAGGFGLTFDPTGESVEVPLEWLEGSPFADYLIPGIVLLTVLGIGPLIAAWGVGGRRRWAWATALLVGVALIVWIGVQIAVVGYHPRPPLQLVYGLVGGGILALVLTRRVRAYLLFEPPNQ